MVRWIRCLWVAALTLAGGGDAFAADTRAFELRTYVTNEGKLPNLLARFRDHTCALFARHGMENIGYWVPLDPADGSSNTLIYLIAHQSRDAAKENWKGFQADPEWKAAREASEASGKILAKAPESMFFSLTDYSPVIAPGPSGADRVFELRTYQAAPGKFEALNSRFRDHTMALFAKHGITSVGYWSAADPAQGGGGTLLCLLTHPSREAGVAAFKSFQADPDWIAAKAASERDGVLTVQGGAAKSILLRPTDFSQLK